MIDKKNILLGVCIIIFAVIIVLWYINYNNNKQTDNVLISEDFDTTATQTTESTQPTQPTQPTRYNKIVNFNGMEFKVVYSTYTDSKKDDYYMIMVDNPDDNTEGALTINTDGTISSLLQYGNNIQQLWYFQQINQGNPYYLAITIDGKYRLAYDGGRLFIVNNTIEPMATHMWKPSADVKNPQFTVLNNTQIAGNYVSNPVDKENTDKLNDLYTKVNNMYEYMKNKGLLDMDRDNMFSKPIEIRLAKGDNFESVGGSTIVDKLAEYEMKKELDAISNGNDNAESKKVPIERLSSCYGCSKL